MRPGGEAARGDLPISPHISPYLPQEGRLLEAIERADELRNTPPTGRGAGSSAPQACHIWGDVGRCGEMWGDRSSAPQACHIWGDVGRCGEMWGDRSSAPQACHSRSERVRTQHRGVEMQCSPVNSAAPQFVCQLYLPISPHTPPVSPAGRLPARRGAGALAWRAASQRPPPRPLRRRLVRRARLARPLLLCRAAARKCLASV